MAQLISKVMNSLDDLRGSPIPVATREKLTTFLLDPPRKVRFKCKVCNKLREHPYVEDPGALKVRDFTCGDAELSCQDWPAVGIDPPPGMAPEFLPGSLVVTAVWTNGHGTKDWPAIVEFSSDEHANYYRRRADFPPHSYYVTLIGTGCGRWYEKHQLVPFRDDHVDPIKAFNQEHMEVLRICEKYIEPDFCGLRRRLLDLSFVGAQLSREPGSRLPHWLLSGGKPTPIQLQNVNIAHRLQKAPIPDATRKKLMDFLRGCPQNIWFECAACAKVRKHPYSQDPGCLRYVCRDANTSCGDAAAVFHLKSRTEFMPGSLVCGKSYGDWGWPAIVEFSTDATADYCVRSEPDVAPQAYYITFIGTDCGGWFEGERLTSFQARINQEWISNPELRDAVSLCAPYLQPGKCDLRRRLLDLSHAATELREEGFELPTWRDLAVNTAPPGSPSDHMAQEVPTERAHQSWRDIQAQWGNPLEFDDI